MYDQIIEAIKSGKIHLQSQNRYRRMFYADGIWEVWGQENKYDMPHCIRKSSDVEIVLKALLGEKEA